MVRLLVLGTAHSVADEAHRHTHMAVVGERAGVLLDCGVCPRSRLAAMGVERDRITDVIITHFHPDHVSGLPLYLMELWLTGRQHPLRIHASTDCLARVEAMLALYEWREWPNMFPISFSAIQYEEKVAVAAWEEFAILASPVLHLIPTTAIRLDLKSGKSVVFSSDTEPSDSLVRLAQGVDLLLHEASGEGIGHCSAAQAGAAANRAGVNRLVLVHYDPTREHADLLREARTTFVGVIDVAVDRMEIQLAGSAKSP
jgi:ribonuclease Z